MFADQAECFVFVCECSEGPDGCLAQIHSLPELLIAIVSSQSRASDELHILNATLVSIYMLMQSTNSVYEKVFLQRLTCCLTE